MRVQGSNENILDYYHEKIRMCRDLGLAIEDTKGQLLDELGIQSKDLFHYLMSPIHSTEDALFVDILNYVRVTESRSLRFQSKPPAKNSCVEYMSIKAVSKPKNNDGVSIENSGVKSHRVCFSCRSKSHIAPSSSIPRRTKRECYCCGSTAHLRSACSERNQRTKNEGATGQQPMEGKGESSRGAMLLEPAYHII